MGSSRKQRRPWLPETHQMRNSNIIKVDTLNLRVLFLAMVACKVEGLVSNARNSDLNGRCPSRFLKMMSDRPKHYHMKSNVQILKKFQAARER
jgi:hypothetical protein